MEQKPIADQACKPGRKPFFRSDECELLFGN